MSDLIITAAVTGSIHTPTMSPALPITPTQIIDEAVRSYEAGAAIVHLHARNPSDGRPSSDLDLFEEIVTGVSARCPVLINLTTGGSPTQTAEERLGVIARFAPPVASFNCGSMNFGLFRMIDRYSTWQHPWEREYLAASSEFVIRNSFGSMATFAAAFAEHGTLPELEVYDIGMIESVRALIDAGTLPARPVFMQFVLGILGGAGASVDNLLMMVRTAERLLGADIIWSTAAAGRSQLPMCLTALALGGHVRVGLEDNLWFGRGTLATSSADQVTRIGRIARELGREPTSPERAKEILGLPRPRQAVTA